MTYPGTWVQLDDYQAGSRRVEYYPAEPVGVGMGTVYRFYDDGHVFGAPDLAANDLNYFIGAADVQVMERLELEGSATASLGAILYSPPNTGSVGVKQLMTLLVAPLDDTITDELGNPVYGLNPPSVIVPPMPAGAVGYEFAEQQGTPVAAIAHFIAFKATGGQDDADPNKAPQGDWAVDVGVDAPTPTGPTSYTASTQFSLSQDAPGPMTLNADVTGIIDGQGYFQVLAQARNVSVEKYTRDDLNTPAAKWSGGITAAIRSSYEAYKSSTNVVVATYTVRPPLFRWIYEGDPPPATVHTAPPLRQFPRDDDLATGSAARHWPPSSSEQGGLRRYGYY